eukprot:7726968-Lingulodinium_polyedra.AAC.1
MQARFGTWHSGQRAVRGPPPWPLRGPGPARRHAGPEEERGFGRGRQACGRVFRFPAPHPARCWPAVHVLGGAAGLGRGVLGALRPVREVCERQGLHALRPLKARAEGPGADRAVPRLRRP